MTFANIYNGISQSKHSNRHGVAREWGIIAGVATPQDQRHIWCSVCYQKHFVSDMWNSAQWLWLSWICTLFHINCLENEFFLLLILLLTTYYLNWKTSVRIVQLLSIWCVCVTTSFICMCACMCGRRWPHVIIVLQSKNKVRLMAQCPLIHMCVYVCTYTHTWRVCETELVSVIWGWGLGSQVVGSALYRVERASKEEKAQVVWKLKIDICVRHQVTVRNNYSYENRLKMRLQHDS